MDCEINSINDLSTLKTHQLDILHTYVCHTSQKLLMTLSKMAAAAILDSWKCSMLQV